MSTVDEASWIADTVGVRRLDEIAVVRVWGPDARSWLNGQVTNQVAKMTAGDAVYALVVSLKGRVLSDLYAVARSEEELLLLVPADRREALLAHFDRYIVMEDVDIAPDDGVVLSAQGPLSADVAPTGFPCARVAAAGRDVVCAPGDAEETEARLVASAAAAGGGRVSVDAWELARLRALRPAFPVDFDETTYPQEAGLKARAVSFDKGCYLGQEVVCMLENRGQLRRHLVQVASAGPIPAGTELRAGEKRVGHVRSGVLDPATGDFRAMAYVKRAHAETGTQLSAGEASATVTSQIGN